MYTVYSVLSYLWTPFLSPPNATTVLIDDNISSAIDPALDKAICRLDPFELAT